MVGGNGRAQSVGEHKVCHLDSCIELPMLQDRGWIGLLHGPVILHRLGMVWSRSFAASWRAYASTYCAISNGIQVDDQIISTPYTEQKNTRTAVLKLFSYYIPTFTSTDNRPTRQGGVARGQDSDSRWWKCRSSRLVILASPETEGVRAPSLNHFPALQESSHGIMTVTHPKYWQSETKRRQN